MLDARQWKLEVLSKSKKSNSEDHDDKIDPINDPSKTKELAAFMHTGHLSSDDEEDTMPTAPIISLSSILETPQDIIVAYLLLAGQGT